MVNLPTCYDNKLLQNYKTQNYINSASSLEILTLTMESSEVTNFLKDVSIKLDKNDLSIEDIIELL